MGRSYSSVALLYSIDANDSYFFCPRQQDTLGGAKVPFLRALSVKKKARNSLQIPRFRFVLPDFGPAFWSNVHPISFASGEGGMEVIDGREGGLAQAKAEETQPYGQVAKRAKEIAG